MNILVTGGTGGVGKAVVELLAADSNNLVYFTYRGSEEKAQEIISNYKNTVAFKCDQTCPESICQLCDAISTWNLDALVNNAWTGTPEGVRFHKLTSEMLIDGFNTNILPLVSITQMALETFRKKEWKNYNCSDCLACRSASIGLWQIRGRESVYRAISKDMEQGIHKIWRNKQLCISGLHANKFYLRYR